MTQSLFRGLRGTDGFTAEVTGAEARRQFRVSIGVVAMLAAGIASTAATIGIHPVAAKRPAAAAPGGAVRAWTAAGGVDAG